MFCTFWNKWASRSTKQGDFSEVLLSQAAFAAVALLFMPLCMYRQTSAAEQAKKAA